MLVRELMQIGIINLIFKHTLEDLIKGTKGKERYTIMIQRRISSQ